MKTIKLLAASLLLSPMAMSQCRILYNNYDLVLQEEFGNETTLATLSQRWQFVHDDPGWGWGDYVDPQTGVRTYGEYYSSSQLSIQNGCLRLTADRLKTPPPIWSNWLGTNRYPNYRSGMIQLRPDLTGAPYDIVGGISGFAYGMFEARVKLPSSACFPAFWLIRAGAPTEIDIFEFGDDNRMISNNVIDWSLPAADRGCQAVYSKSTGATLPDDFHTISCVWTPTRVTFFFDGRETRTVDYSQKHTYGHTPLAIILNLAMNPWHSATSTYMDIDYVRVYKPKQNNYNLQYKNSAESIAHDVFTNATGTLTNVHPDANSIATNPNNANEVFYRGTDNYIYQALRSGGVWNVKKLLYNDGAPVLAAGDVRYLPQHDMVLYVGQNNRINLFGRSTSTGTGFYHWYLTSNWGCYWCVTDDYIYPAQGSLQTTPNGEVFYRGLDNKMHRYYYAGGNWNHQILVNSATSELVKGDIVVDPNGGTNNVFYKGNDDRLQTFYKSGGVYAHGWIDDNWGSSAYLVNNKPGSMVWSVYLNGVLYNGADNKLHLYYWNTNWYHQLIPYSYNAPTLGYPGADFLNGSIEWNNNDRALWYVGYDGRMQAFVKDMATGNWLHYWIDDFWNTSLYHSFNSGQTGKYASCRLGPDGSMFYTRADGHPGYFKYEPCENLNPPCNDFANPRVLLKKEEALEDVSVASSGLQMYVFPNPASEYISVLTNQPGIGWQMDMYDLTGKVVLSRQVRMGEEVDVRSLARGVYTVRLSGSGTSRIQRVQLN